MRKPNSPALGCRPEEEEEEEAQRQQKWRPALIGSPSSGVARNASGAQSALWTQLLLLLSARLFQEKTTTTPPPPQQPAKQHHPTDVLN
ncbi:Hypothetical predicted protein [Podarcis lilfordi]|uniref:Uncharacterized protein n=1 Tax=Podarcis lilfordi TaxID=74358 RepID=A0AA35LCY2_9SAUR|nr:Hypothetical predicted protein [Podarcis lilfordi]